MRSSSSSESVDMSSEDPANSSASKDALDSPAALPDETVVTEVSTSASAAAKSAEADLHTPADSKPAAEFYGSAAGPPVTALPQDPISLPRNAPELVGERLPRSHTLHTKILTLPGAVAIALIGLFGVTAAIWLQRDRVGTAPTASVVEKVNELSLPTRAEVALQQDNLDEATVAVRALIDQGQFTEAIAALQSADQTQQQDAVIAFLQGRAQWGLVKQSSSDYSVDDAMRSWTTALESESDWMEIMMALGFAQHALGRDQEALESWQRAVSLANRQPNAKGAYFSDQTFGEYALNAQAGIAIAALSLSEIETDPNQKEQLIEQAAASYQKVITEAPADFNANSLGANWLWLEGAIADWEATKAVLSSTIQVE